MSFAIPSLADLAARSRSAFRRYLPGSDAWLFPNNLNVSAKVLAGLGSELFGFADYIQRQKFAGTADGENLELHAQEVGLSRRPASPAQGKMTIAASDAIAVSAGAVFRRTDGVDYLATGAAGIAGAGTLDVPVIAAKDGKVGNANGGTPVEIISGVVDTNGDALATAAVQTAGIVAGLDVEADGEDWTTDLGSLRGRVLFRKRNPPHGGAPADYVQWASEVSGVTRVFVERRYAGNGSVRVFPLMDDLYSDGIPLVADVERVQDYINTVAPAGAVVVVAAPVAHPVAVTITGLAPSTTATQEAVLAELRDTFRRLSRVAGIDSVVPALPFLATPYSFSRGWIWQAVGNSTGVSADEITAPAADVAIGTAEIPTLGTVSFV